MTKQQFNKRDAGSNVSYNISRAEVAQLIKTHRKTKTVRRFNDFTGRRVFALDHISKGYSTHIRVI